MTTSRHYRWQTRWRFAEDGSAVHECGLVVRFAPNGWAEPVNGDAIEAELRPKNGPHNAPLMVRRMCKEAGLLWKEKHL